MDSNDADLFETMSCPGDIETCKFTLIHFFGHSVGDFVYWGRRDENYGQKGRVLGLCGADGEFRIQVRFRGCQ